MKKILFILGICFLPLTSDAQEYKFDSYDELIESTYDKYPIFQDDIFPYDGWNSRNLKEKDKSYTPIIGQEWFGETSYALSYNIKKEELGLIIIYKAYLKYEHLYDLPKSKITGYTNTTHCFQVYIDGVEIPIPINNVTYKASINEDSNNINITCKFPLKSSLLKAGNYLNIYIDGYEGEISLYNFTKAYNESIAEANKHNEEAKKQRDKIKRLLD